MAVDATDDLVFRKAVSLLGKYNAKNIDITPDTDITADLEIDSVAVLDLVMEVEDEYGVSFPMSRISEIRTVGDLTQAVHDLAKAK